MQGLIEPILKSCYEELGADATRRIIEDGLELRELYGVYAGGNVVETSNGKLIYVKNGPWAKGASLHCTKARNPPRGGTITRLKK